MPSTTIMQTLILGIMGVALLYCAGIVLSMAWDFFRDRPRFQPLHSIAAEQDAMTFYTGACRECGFLTEPDVPLRRFERELEIHSRTTQHTMFQVDAWVLLGEAPPVSPRQG